MLSLRCYHGNEGTNTEHELDECSTVKCKGDCTFCVKSVSQLGVLKDCGGLLLASNLELLEDGCKTPNEDHITHIALLWGMNNLQLFREGIICRCHEDACNGGSSLKLFTMFQSIITAFTITSLNFPT